MINIAKEIVSTSYDPVKRESTYVLRRGSFHWTVTVLDAHFKGTREARRNHLLMRLMNAMAGAPDEEKSGAPVDTRQLELS